MATEQRAWPNVLVVISWLIVGIAGLLVFRALDFGVSIAILVVLAIVAGGRINIPLVRRRDETAERRARAELSVNVGGGLIPLGLAAHQAVRLPASFAEPLGLATAAVATMSYVLARPVAGRGIVLPWVLPALMGAALALILAPSGAPNLAFAAGALGTFLGADILHLPSLKRIGAIRMSIGGDGPFDGLLWSGLFAAGMAGGF
jgi:uncharacterized membrane protein